MPTYLYVCANRKLGPLYSTSHVRVIMGIMVLTLNYNLLVSKLRSAEMVQDKKNNKNNILFTTLFKANCHELYIEVKTVSLSWIRIAFCLCFKLTQNMVRIAYHLLSMSVLNLHILIVYCITQFEFYFFQVRKLICTIWSNTTVMKPTQVSFFGWKLEV